MSPLRRLLSVILLTAFLPSCYRWQEVGPTPRAAIGSAPTSTLYITRAGGSTLVLRNVLVVGDSVVGHRMGGGTTASPSRVAIPLDDVTRVRTRNGLNEGKTGGLVAGLAAAAALILGGVYLITYEEGS
jgi:hypothetical protein